MPLVGVEPAISSGKRSQTYALGCMATAPSSNTKVKERVDLYLYSPFGTLACSRGNFTFYKNKYTKVTDTYQH